MSGVQVLSYDLMKNQKSGERIRRILDAVKKGDVVMIEGKMKPEEEAELISRALKSVSGRFSGIETAYLSSSTSQTTLEKIKDKIIQVIARDRVGITVVGPSKKIKEIKMDPEKLEILFK